MNKTIGIIVAIVVIIGGAYLIMAKTPKTSDTGSNTSGRVVFSVTDAAADMSTISEINMKVNKAEMHSTAEGWVTASTTPHTYSLLALNAENKSELLADIRAK